MIATSEWLGIQLKTFKDDGLPAAATEVVSLLWLTIHLSFILYGPSSGL